MRSFLTRGRVQHGRPDARTLLGVAPKARLLLDNAALPPERDVVAVEFATAEPHTVGRNGDGNAPAPGDLFDAVVLADVLDRVVRPADAVRAARDLLTPGGRILVLQQVAPSDYALRALLNAVLRLRDPSHTSTPTRQELRRMLDCGGLVLDRDVVWTQPEPLSPEPGRPGAGPGADFLGHLAENGVPGLVEDGRWLAVRVATVLRMKG